MSMRRREALCAACWVWRTALFLTGLCATLSVAAEEGVVGAARRTSGAVLELDFLRADCLNGIFPFNSSHGEGGIILLESGACLPHNGLRRKASGDISTQSPVAKSAVLISSILNALGSSNSISFAFWLLPPPDLTSEAESFSLFTFVYEGSQVACSFSIDITEESMIGSRQNGAVFCQSDGSVVRLAEGTSYSDQSDVSSMHYVVVTFQFTEVFYQGLGTVNSVFTNSSYDGVKSTMISQSDHVINKHSFHPSAFPAASETYLALISGLGGTFWEGSLLQLSMYPLYLTPQDIQFNYNAGLKNSLPLSWNRSVFVQEDILSNTSLPVFDADNQAWHINFKLNCGNVNESSWTNVSNGVCRKMYVRLVQLPLRGELFVPGNDLPLTLTDTIEFSDSTKGIHLKEPSSLGSDNYVVDYRPNPNEFSTSNDTVFDAFRFVAVDGWTAETSDVGTVSITVLPVNDPPVAMNASARLYSRQCVVLPKLRGCDSADEKGNSSHISHKHHNVDRAVILSLPKNGTIHQVFPDMSISPTAITHIPSSGALFLDTPFTIGYCFNGNENEILSTTFLGEAVIGTDVFDFAILDNMNMSSRPAMMSLEILSPLEGISKSVYANLSGIQSDIPLEATLSNLTLFGRFVSDSEMKQVIEGFEEIIFQIEGLPLNGTLLNLSDESIIVKGGEIHVSRDSFERINNATYFHVSVGYKSHFEFFTEPKLTWEGNKLDGADSNDHVVFSVFTRSNLTKEVIAVTNTKTQFIEVRNKNDPTEFNFSFHDAIHRRRGYFEVHAWSPTSSVAMEMRHERPKTMAKGWKSLFDSSIDQSGVAQYNASIGAYISMDNAFELTDWDKGTDIIKARIISTNTKGLVTLNTQHVGGVDFNSASYCFSSHNWQCLGDGYNNGQMIFVGTPKNISMALNGLQYLSLLPHHTDILNISLFDGAGGECFEEDVLLHDRNPSTTSFRNMDCFISSISIEIRVVGYHNFQDDDDDTWSSETENSRAMWMTRLLQVGVLVIILVFLYCVCCLPLFKLYKRIFKKGGSSDNNYNAPTKEHNEIVWESVQKTGEEIVEGMGQDQKCTKNRSMLETSLPKNSSHNMRPGEKYDNCV